VVRFPGERPFRCAMVRVPFQAQVQVLVQALVW
jgi:hypothetical protein